MSHHILTLGQINEALRFASVNAAQLSEMGFKALDNKEVCESLPKEQARPLWGARLYPVGALPLIRGKLATLIGQQITPAPAGPEFERKHSDDTEGGALD